jgi:hypothetical protein
MAGTLARLGLLESDRDDRAGSARLISWSDSVTLSITITITATTDDRFLAETPEGSVEAGSLRELGDRLRELLANLEDETASDLSELARLSRSATDQATLLGLARTSPPPDAWFEND